MKTIPNLTFAIKFQDREGEVVTTKLLLDVCLAMPPLPSQQNPQGGFDYASMRARSRVADALKKVEPGGEISLEDADFATAKEAVQAKHWSVNHPDLVKFAEQFGA